MINLNELFADSSNIYPIEKVYNSEYSFSVDNVKYYVSLFNFNTFGIMAFYYIDENGVKKSIPTQKNNKNQFKILNTVFECVKLIMTDKENNLDVITFNGTTNGLKQVYRAMCKRLKPVFSNYDFHEEENNFVFTKREEKLNELFTDSSNIYPVEKVSNREYKFSDDLYQYKVRLHGEEIYFSYYDENNEMWMTRPTKNNKNQFKILNTVIYCFKEIITNNDEDEFKFSGQISNGLAKLYMTLFNKLKNTIIDNGYVGFYTDGNFETYFFLIKKEDFYYNHWKNRIDPESLVGYSENINELFTNSSSNNIEPYTFNYKNSYKIKGYKFSINDNTYFVCNEDGEITFGLITDDNNLITSPTNLGKNQFKILSNVVQCIKLFLEEKPKEIFFTGNIKNGLGKLYKTIFNRLQDENYVSFTDSRSELATYFYYVRKDIFKPNKYNIDNGSLRNYKIEEKSKYLQNSLEKNMKRKINEAVTISVQNTKNGYNNNVTMKFVDVNELAQLIKNAGISDYVEINSELPVNTDLGYSDAFDFGDRGNEELEPYDVLATEVGYSSECLVIYVDNSVVDVVIQYTNQKYNLNPIDIISYDDYAALIYTCGDIYSVSEFLVNELLNICPGMIYGSNLINSYEEIEECASIDAATPYEYDAEESPYNIKGPAHQMNLRYVPGIMADNPMTDELRESVEDKALILSKVYKIGQECGKVCHEAGDENGEVKRNALKTVLQNHEKEIENGEISKLEIKKEFRRGFENFKSLKESVENKDSELLKIASKYFDFDSFNETNSGDDFKEVAVWSVEKALKAAYELGKKG